MGSSGASIGVVVALREELRALEPRFEDSRPLSAGALRCRAAGIRGVEVILLRTGIGRENAARATARLLDELGIAAVVAAGFAGALSAELACGDLLVAAEVKEVSCPSVWAAAAPLLELAASIKLDFPPVKAGSLLTTDKVVSRPAEKRALAQAYQAQAVDMESSAVVREAGGRGVPVLCARAILDEADYELPFDFGKVLTAGGKLRPMGLLSAVRERPRGFLELEGLRRRSRRASDSLAAFIPALVEAMGRWTAEKQ